MMDQLYRWALIEAAEGGMRNFGMPMKVTPVYKEDNGDMWGFDVEIIKEGVKQTVIGVGMDNLFALKHEWVGQGKDGFPTLEGKSQDIAGKNFEIWKMDNSPVDEDLRRTIRSFCTGLASAMNRYYAFGSVFAEEV